MRYPIFGDDGCPDCYVLIDDEDLDRIETRSWRLSVKGRVCSRGVEISRFLLDAPKGTHVHHINEDVFDNRKSNLEVLTPTEHIAGHMSGVGRNARKAALKLSWKTNRSSTSKSGRICGSRVEDFG